MLPTLLIGLIVPWVFGFVGLRLLRLPALLTLGAGFLLGMIGLTLLLRTCSSLGWPLQFSPIVFLLLALTLVLTPLAVKARSQSGGEGTRFNELGYTGRLFFGALLIVLIGRYAAFAWEILWQPMLAWDAWASWAVKAKVWFYQHQITPFVSNQAWLSQADNPVYTVIGSDYPATIPLIQTWTSLAWGDWREAAANSAWPLCALALGLGFYSHCRISGGSALAALMFTYLLLSIPLLNTHIALPGYADIWLASTYGLAALSLLQWCQSAHHGHLVLALLLACTLPMLKVDGTVWAFSLLALIIARLAGRWLWGVLLLALAMGITWYSIGGFRWGDWTLTTQLIELPYIGRYELSYTSNWPAVREQLLFGGSWNMLWYFAPLSLLSLAIPGLRQRSAALFYGALLLLLNLFVLYSLFFFTHAARWASDATSINRLFLHITPLAVFLLLLLFQQLSAHKAKASAERPAQS